jgi:type I restriction enzyme S subunit
MTRSMRILEFLKESRIPGTSGDTARKITVKLYGKGVFAKQENKPGSENTSYYKRKAGQFIYSKLDFLNGAFGIVPDDLDGYESTVDLPCFDFTSIEIHPDWFLYFVSRRDFYSYQGGLGNGGRKARRISPDDFLELEIDVPPLPEQKKIAEILSGVDRLISLLDKKETVLKSLLQAATSRIFSFSSEDYENLAMRLCDIVDPARPITYGIVQTGEKLLEGVPCVRVADFDLGILDTSTMIKTSKEINSQYERTILQEGDLMVALRGDIGRTEIAGNKLEGANLTRGVALLSKSDGVLPKYLRYAMCSPGVKRQIKDGTNGSALQEIPLKNLREILVPMPSKAQQIEDAAFLESIENALVNNRAKRKSLELCKFAVSSDLLSGRKRVTL